MEFPICSDGYNSAEFFCSCSTPETLLCKDCVGEHLCKTQGVDHTLRLIFVLNHYKLRGHAARYRSRVGALTRMRRDIDDSLEEVERTLPEDNPQLFTKYGPSFRKIIEDDRPDRGVFPIQATPKHLRMSSDTSTTTPQKNKLPVLSPRQAAKKRNFRKRQDASKTPKRKASEMPEALPSERTYCEVLGNSSVTPFMSKRSLSRRTRFDG